MMLVLIGAYGRNHEYGSIEEAEKDWNDGKDFKIIDGPYCSIRDLEMMKRMGHDVVLAVIDKITKKSVYKFIHRSN